MDVGFIGLGAMGRPMAANIAKQQPCRVFNRTAAVAQEHAAQHGTVASTLEEVAGCDVILSCLPLTADVVGVSDRVRDRLKAGAVWVDHTSGDPAQSRELAARLADRDVTYLDAPVSGGTDGAEAGTLTMMVGGAEGALDRVRPVLESMAGKIVHVGPVGAGHAVKAVNNTLLALQLLGSAEGLLALAGAGVDPTTALEVINGSSGRSNATENLIPQRVVTREFPVTFALGLLAKDCGIGQAVLDDTATVAPLLRLTAELVRAARTERGGEVDHSEVVRIVERLTGREIVAGTAQD